MSPSSNPWGGGGGGGVSGTEPWGRLCSWERCHLMCRQRWRSVGYDLNQAEFGTPTSCGRKWFWILDIDVSVLWNCLSAHWNTLWRSKIYRNTFCVFYIASFCYTCFYSLARVTYHTRMGFSASNRYFCESSNIPDDKINKRGCSAPYLFIFSFGNVGFQAFYVHSLLVSALPVTFFSRFCDISKWCQATSGRLDSPVHRLFFNRVFKHVTKKEREINGGRGMPYTKAQ